MDDDGLIAAVAAGDDTALRELFSRHAPWLAARLRAVLPAADVEDVLQETFLAVWRGAGGYRPGGAAGRLAVGHRPPAGRAVAAPPRPGRAAAARRGRGGHAGTRPTRRRSALARADLAAAVAALGPAGGPEREVWRLMYVEDRPVAEVAALMGVPRGHGEEPRAPGPAAAAGGAARRRGAGRRSR